MNELDVLTKNITLSEDKINSIKNFSSKHNCSLIFSAVFLDIIKREEYYDFYAELHDLELRKNKYKTLDDIKIDYTLQQKIKRRAYFKHRFILDEITDDEIVVISQEKFCEKFEKYLYKKLDRNKIKYLITDKIDIVDLLLTIYKDELLDKAVYRLERRNPKKTSMILMTKNQKIVLWTLLFTYIILLIENVSTTILVSIFIVQMFYFIAVGYKFLTSVNGSIDEILEKTSSQGALSLTYDNLSTYTILLPLYKEDKMVKKLVANIKKLDYSMSKLDVLILLEKDDYDTRKAFLDNNIPLNFTIISIDHSIPKTKPKACNYGLIFTESEFVTIYDAEDRPDIDQLKVVHSAFNNKSNDYVCFQAALNYFNKSQNFLTKMFTLEYSYWYDYMLPGLYKLQLPIPLGGTSNHFRSSWLKRIGGWDSFNTTEDADLGIRIYSQNKKIGVVRSTTYEEANSKLWNWITQRTRWIKGYIQTSLVYTRSPIKNIKEMGIIKWISLHLLIGGTPIIFLLNPILLIILIITIINKNSFINYIFGDFVLVIALFNFLISNILVVYMNMLGAFRRRNFDIILYSLLNPIYWLLHSFAAYRALIQLITKPPHHWEKTIHGLNEEGS